MMIMNVEGFRKIFHFGKNIIDGYTMNGYPVYIHTYFQLYVDEIIAITFTMTQKNADYSRSSMFGYKKNRHRRSYSIIFSFTQSCRDRATSSTVVDHE